MPLSQRARKILITIFLLMSPVLVALMMYFAVKAPARAQTAARAPATKAVEPGR
jgi:preprotein translocase subunit YajC